MVAARIIQKHRFCRQYDREDLYDISKTYHAYNVELKYMKEFLSKQTLGEEHTALPPSSTTNGLGS